jgi:AcrR family transcriptional regulator
VAVVKKHESSRQAKAEATSARIVHHAYQLLCERGYRGTTMEAIAGRAGVAIQTVYFVFHTKDHLLQAVHSWTVLGEENQPPQRQGWHIAALQEADAARALGRLVAGIATIDARMAPLIPVYHAVSTDPAGEIYQRSEQLRRDDMAKLVDTLTKKTPLRQGVTRRQAADLIFVLTGPECYRSFVLDAGWTQQQWVRWVSRTLRHDLLPRPT